MEDLCTESAIKFFENYSKVLEALAERRFITLVSDRFRLYVFRGARRDYIVSPCRFCMCEDFVINFVNRDRQSPCYHVVGFKIAELRGKIVELEIDIDTLAKIVEEVVGIGISPTLRKILR